MRSEADPGTVVRHYDGLISDDTAPSKALQRYEKLFEQNTEFFTTYNPDYIEESILGFLNKNYPEVVVTSKENKYKMKFTLPMKREVESEEGKEQKEPFVEQTPIQVRIL